MLYFFSIQLFQNKRQQIYQVNKRMKKSTLTNQSNKNGTFSEGPGRPIPDQQLPEVLFDGIYLLQLWFRKILDTKL